MPFDITGARSAGYTDDEIRQHLGSSFDVAGAEQAGYTLDEIAQHVSRRPAPLNTSALVPPVTAESVFPTPEAAPADVTSVATPQPTQSVAAPGAVSPEEMQIRIAGTERSQPSPVVDELAVSHQVPIAEDRPISTMAITPEAVERHGGVPTLEPTARAAAGTAAEFGAGMFQLAGYPVRAASGLLAGIQDFIWTGDIDRAAEGFKEGWRGERDVLGKSAVETPRLLSEPAKAVKAPTTPEQEAVNKVFDNVVTAYFVTQIGAALPGMVEGTKAAGTQAARMAKSTASKVKTVAKQQFGKLDELHLTASEIQNVKGAFNAGEAVSLTDRERQFYDVMMSLNGKSRAAQVKAGRISTVKWPWEKDFVKPSAAPKGTKLLGGPGVEVPPGSPLTAPGPMEAPVKPSVSVPPVSAAVQQAPSPTGPIAPVQEAQPVPLSEIRPVRKPLAEMTQEELFDFVMHDPRTGLGSKIAYEEAPKKRVQGMVDMDALKWTNDNIDYESGSVLIQSMGKALKDAGFGEAGSSIEAYMVGGDEARIQGNSREEVDKALEKATLLFRQTTIEAELPDGTRIILKNPGFSYGVAESDDLAFAQSESERLLHAHKAEREATGVRPARGERPPGVVEVPPSGEQVGEGGGVLPSGVRTETPAPAQSTAVEPTAEPASAQPVEPTTPVQQTTQAAVKAGKDNPALFHTGQQEPTLASQSGAVRFPGPNPDANSYTSKNAFAESVKATLGHWFLSRGDFPQEIFDLAVKRQGRINVSIREMERAVNAFYKEVSPSYGHSALTDDEAFQLHAVLTGQEDITNIPEGMRPIIRQMRTGIDVFSQAMVDEGIVEGPLAEFILGNRGFYAARTYRVHRDPKWSKKVPAEVRNTAKAYIRSERMDRADKLLLDTESKLDELAGKKAALQSKERLPEGVSEIDERMLGFRQRADKIFDTAHRQLSTQTKKIKAEIATKQSAIGRKIEQLNAQKTNVWRETPEIQEPNLGAREKALEGKVDKLDEQIAEWEGDKAALAELEMRMDETIAELEKTREHFMLQPTQLKDIDDRIARFNDLVRGAKANISKLDRVEVQRISKMASSVLNRATNAVQQLNRVKTQVFRAEGADVTGVTRTVPEQLEAIDSRIETLSGRLNQLKASREISEEELDGLIENLLYQDSAPMGVLSKGGKLGSKNLSMLKRRKNIPPEIRALWGEDKNADMNFVFSVWQMTNALANHEFLTEALSAGENKFFFKTPRVTSEGSFSAMIAAEGSSAMSPLNGWYTTPAIKKAFEEAVTTENLPDWLRFYMKAVSATKYAKTIASAMTHLRNFTANPLFALANGHFNVGEAKGAFAASFGDVFDKSPEAMQEEIEDLVRRGVLGDGARAGEMRAMINAATAGSIDNIIGIGPHRKIKRAVRVGEKLYGAEDDFWKYFGFKNEYANYRKAYPEWTEEQVRDRAAKIVRNGYPTYSMTPRLTKKLARFPFLGTFVSFVSEIPRTGYHTIGLIAEEFRDPKTQAIGTKRLTGLVLAITLPIAVVATGRYFGNVNKKKEEAYRAFLPPWSENGELFWLPFGESTAPYYIDLSYSNPHAYLRNAVIAFMRGEDWESKLVNTVGELAAPFLSEDIFTSTMLDITRNKTRNGQPVWNPQDTPEAKALAISEHLWGAVEPGTLRGASRIVKAMKGEEGKAGTAYNAPTELMAQLSGVRVSKLDVPRSLGFQAYRFTEDLKDARRLSYKKNIPLSRQQTQKLYDDFYNRKVRAAKTLGMTDNEIIMALMDGGMTKNQAGGIVFGLYDKQVDAYFKRTQLIKDYKDRAKSGETAVDTTEARTP